MTRILAIDPGNIQSAFVVIDTATRRPIIFDKVDNEYLRKLILLNDRSLQHNLIAIEMVESYGMAVGIEIFETCVWIGRYAEIATQIGTPMIRTGRKPIKRWICGTTTAKDRNVTQALVDRFAPAQPNYGKGTKAAPGWFHGFHRDIWQAYALAVHTADTLEDAI